MATTATGLDVVRVSHAPAVPLRGSMEPATRLPLSWGMAGGVVAGGILVAP